MVSGIGILTSGTRQLGNLFRQLKLIFRLAWLTAITGLTGCVARHRYFDLRCLPVVASLSTGKVNISAGIAKGRTGCGARHRYFDLQCSTVMAYLYPGMANGTTGTRWLC